VKKLKGRMVIPRLRSGHTGSDAPLYAMVVDTMDKSLEDYREQIMYADQCAVKRY
jgi:hypothetical protein